MEPPSWIFISDPGRFMVGGQSVSLFTLVLSLEYPPQATGYSKVRYQVA
jgi:hypothetical protein